MTVECILCAEEVEWIGVGQCNHEPMCFRCIYKMRVNSKNNQCPICKAHLTSIIIMPGFMPFQEAIANTSQAKLFSDIFFTCPEAQQAFERLNQFKCFVRIDGKACKHEKKFQSMAFLHKHLKEEHKRYMCEVCSEKTTCVLEEMKVYTHKALDRHLTRGDVDEYGNITFLHPYCAFCRKYFFDEEEFRVHINREHISCNVCGVPSKYIYYKDYQSLEVHFKMSHYLCSDEDCLAKKWIAFKSADELKVHRLQFHEKNGMKKIDVKDLCGFYYEGHNPNDDSIVIKDKEGVNMEDQFLNLKKCKNRALGEADQQVDSLIDPRVFYEPAVDEDELYQRSFLLGEKRKPQEGKPQEGKKKKYVQKLEVSAPIPPIPPIPAEDKQGDQFYFQDLQIARTLHLPRVSPENFQARLRQVLRKEDFAQFVGLRTKLFKSQIGVREYFQSYLRIMRGFSIKHSYLIFPHFIRTIQNEDIRRDLDEQFGLQLKSLPFRSNCLIYKSKRYGDFFQNLLREIEKNISGRIQKGVLSIKKPIRRCKQRLFQLVGVLRRLRIEEMAKLKYALNFGIHKETQVHLNEVVFKADIAQVQKGLQLIGNEELLDLYVFVKFCLQVIKHSKDMQTEKHKIHQNILEDFLFQRPHLLEQFGAKKEQMANIQEQIQFEQMAEDQRVKKQLIEITKKNERKGYQTKTDFNLVDKGDFPELVPSKKEPEAKGSIKEQSFKAVFENNKSKPATYQKSINEMFPALGEVVTSESKPAKKEVAEKEEKSWWEKLNSKGSQVVEEEAEERIRTRKGKRKEKWVSVKGIFN